MTARAVTGAARVAGVVGWPVRHSLSPLIHGAWIEAARLDALYAPFAVDPNAFDQAVRGLQAAGLSGVNVTLPHKEAALALADRCDDAAGAAGAANLLIFGQDGIEARNTDGLGLLAAFAEQAPSWRPDLGPVLVLGAGGAARGAATALRTAGAEVLVANRTHERARALADGRAGVTAVAFDALGTVMGEVSALVNATSASLPGQGGLDLPLEGLRPGTVVMDMVYSPLRTPLLRRAAELGLTTVDGLAMLIGQARPSFEALFGSAPPASTDVRALALRALGEIVG